MLLKCCLLTLFKMLHQVRSILQLETNYKKKQNDIEQTILVRKQIYKYDFFKSNTRNVLNVFNI